ncbi:hypothetical protein O181_075224 [Austropuccinia psidii MF-1]|uniref:Integrase catalytic domain-containing protein n=1 Tax=Austropuccinia psidii MF-1 TaxID=1389203 RepID=A0A9Q3IE89_9BASI|nr:hypothetical protein [Austropuccinia psidii MF-1]
MGDSSKLPDISSLSVSDPVLCANQQAEILQRFSLIADRIQPRLSIDGSNFNTWSRNMISTWETCFIEDIKYFDSQERDLDYRRNLIALSFIQNSVERSLFDSIISWLSMPNARSVYQAIKKRFSKASWSSIVNHANVIFHPSTQSSNLMKRVIDLGEAVAAIEGQIGPIDSNKIITLSLFFSIPHLHDQITAALDTRLAANPSLTINAEDILDIVQQMNNKHVPTPPEDSMQLSRIEASRLGNKMRSASHQGNRTPPKSTAPYLGLTTPQSASPIVNRSDGWKRRWLTPQNPCFYCGEVGHWAPDCPARLKAANARASSSKQKATVASMGTVPILENNEALLDSGATHSVTNNLSLFTNIRRTNMNLSVASSQQFQIDTIGDIQLNTSHGPLLVRDVLFCKDIPGVVLSIGQLISQGILVRLNGNIFTIQQGGHIFSTFQRNHRWFLSLVCVSENHAVHDISTESPPPVNFNTHPNNNRSSDLNALWHRRMGHLSIRNIKRLLQFKAADGIPNFNFENIKICHPCLISKAEHRPFQSPSRGHIKAPSDLVAADLIGPLPASIDHKKYALMIQDSFSRMTAVIPLNDKTEAKHQLRFWIIRFNNTTDFKIKSIRTDNGTEFCNHFLSGFLKEEGITHELSIPYEHHQNGKIERTNRTISKMARTSLLATLHANNKITPYEIVGKRRPSLVALRVFGAKSYIFNHSSLKNISAKGFVGYHLGITPDSKGWLFWVPERKTIVRSASMKFDEETPYITGLEMIAGLANIQVNDVFDASMIKQIELQDSFVSEINSGHGVMDPIPMSYDEALMSAESDRWKQAIDEELQCMKDQDVFEFHDLGNSLREVPRELILSTKWVFTKKTRPKKFKSRLVARGFRQIHGINFEETFAPTPTFGALRMLFSIACQRTWPILTFDVKVAFLHSLIDKPVYLWPPKGIEVPPHSVLKLRKALYGTKQAARCWWLPLKTILNRIGFTSNGEDASTYSYNSDEGSAILWIHVDDGALTGSSKELLEKICDQLNENLQIKWDAEVSGLIGLSIDKFDNRYKFSQSELIDKLTSLSKSNITSTSPLPSPCVLKSNAGTNMDKEYLRRIGMLLYIAQASRPDISFAVNYLARFSMGTDNSHWQALEHLIGYMRKTRDMGVIISANKDPKDITCYVDANWGGEGSRSTHGFLIMHGGNSIMWQLKRQITVAASTAQAEYIALSFAAKEALWLSNMFSLFLKNPLPQLLSDNRTAIGIANESMSRKQTRHLIREFNIINEYVVKGKLNLAWISTTDQLADIMTKSLGSINVKKFLKGSNIT